MNTENDYAKKEWINPEFYVLEFKKTKGGMETATNEDYGFDPLSDDGN